MKNVLKISAILIYSLSINAIKYGNDNSLEWGLEREYLFPNEFNPENLYPLIKRAPKGILIGVGTFRNLFMLSMDNNGKFRHTIIADNNPNVINFAGYLLSLIEISKTRQQFLENINGRSVTYDTSRKYHYKKHFNEVNYREFKSVLKCDLKSHFCEEYKILLSGKIEKDGPVGNTFFSDDKLYNRLKKYVDKGSISLVNLDFSKLKEVSKFAEQIEKFDDKISLLDLSNCQGDEYLGYHNIGKVLKILQQVAFKRSLLVLTNFFAHNGFSNDKKFSEKKKNYKVQYLGIPFDDFDSRSLCIMQEHDIINPNVKISYSAAPKLWKLAKAIQQAFMNKSIETLSSLYLSFQETLTQNVKKVNRHPIFLSIAWLNFLEAIIKNNRVEETQDLANFLVDLNSDKKRLLGFLDFTEDKNYAKRLSTMDEKDWENCEPAKKYLSVILDKGAWEKHLDNPMAMAVMGNDPFLVSLILDTNPANEDIKVALDLAFAIGNKDLANRLLPLFLSRQDIFIVKTLRPEFKPKAEKDVNEITCECILL